MLDSDDDLAPRLETPEGQRKQVTRWGRGTLGLSEDLSAEMRARWYGAAASVPLSAMSAGQRCRVREMQMADCCM